MAFDKKKKDNVMAGFILYPCVTFLCLNRFCHASIGVAITMVY